MLPHLTSELDDSDFFRGEPACTPPRAHSSGSQKRTENSVIGKGMSSGSDEATRPTVARGEALFFCLSIRFRDAPRNRKSKKRIACRVHRRASWEHARECG